MTPKSASDLPTHTNDLHNDIDRLDEWSDRWKLRFNIAKCKKMHIGYHNDKHIYQMGSGERRMDLYQVTSKKRSGYYFPRRPPVYQTLGRQSQEGKIHARSYSSQFPIHRQRDAYTSLHVEYVSSVWSSFKLIEGVQRRATILSRDLFGINHTTSDSPPWAYQHFNSEEIELTYCKCSKS